METTKKLKQKIIIIWNCNVYYLSVYCGMLFLYLALVHSVLHYLQIFLRLSLIGLQTPWGRRIIKFISISLFPNIAYKGYYQQAFVQYLFPFYWIPWKKIIASSEVLLCFFLVNENSKNIFLVPVTTTQFCLLFWA